MSKNIIKYIFAIYCENKKRNDFVILTSKFHYEIKKKKYLKAAGNPKAYFFKTMKNEIQKILLADPIFKLLCVVRLDAGKINKFRKSLEEYFKKDITLLRNCQECSIPPLPPHPNKEECLINDVIGDIIERDGINYIQQDDGTILTFEEAEKKYGCLTEQTDQMVI